MKYEVFENWSGKEPVKIGDMHIKKNRGHESVSFAYDPDWLKQGNYAFDPNLELYGGGLNTNGAAGVDYSWILLDGVSDSWGRSLLRAQELRLATQENRKPIKLTATDYLLEGLDSCRSGALRFRYAETGEFVSSAGNAGKSGSFAMTNASDVCVSSGSHDSRGQSEENSAGYRPVFPSLENLKELQDAAMKFELDGYTGEDDGDEKDISSDIHDKSGEKKIDWFEVLLECGACLGGSRPKANVIDANGDLWIAKFPSKYDKIDAGAWEKTVQDLARMIGLRTVETRLFRISDAGSTFLIKRFDRTGGERRIHFVSAMTLLGKSIEDYNTGSYRDDDDDDNHHPGYIEIAEFIRAYGSRPKEDLSELWRRVVFSMAVSNTDDHLRNHGFLLEDAGWTLSPLYDVNPDIYGKYLALDVSPYGDEISKENAMELADIIGLDLSRAEEEFRRIMNEVSSNWKQLAMKNGISENEIEQMAGSFRFALKQINTFERAGEQNGGYE